MITLPRSPLQQCFGREDLCNAVVNSALEAGAVLLFGGRQAGKTTLLREIAKTLSAERAHLGSLKRLLLTTVINLMVLPHDSTPGDFFALLYRNIRDLCLRQVDGSAPTMIPPLTAGDRLTFDDFLSRIASIREALSNIDCHFLLSSMKRRGSWSIGSLERSKTTYSLFCTVTLRFLPVRSFSPAPKTSTDSVKMTPRLLEVGQPNISSRTSP